MSTVITNLRDLVEVAADEHASKTDNPHEVTQAQVGLSEVDNTSDADKPISSATQDALDLKAAISGQEFTGDVTVPNLLTSGKVDGRDVSVDGDKLDGIEDNATADQTDAEILTAVKNVDGSDSGLDADLLDGQDGSFYQDAANLNTGIISDDRLPDSISSDITGNAGTATVWETARTISASGDATGSASIDGSSDVAIVLTVKDDVALGGNPTTTTQNVSDESTKIATTQYVVDKINETEEVE